jgi:hypothetical protein
MYPSNSSSPTVFSWTALNCIGFYEGSSYWIIEGFQMIANNSQVDIYGGTLAGVAVTAGSHHINVLNNYIFNAGEAGVGANGDYILVQGNTIVNTSHISPYGGSCIGTWTNPMYDQEPGYHIKIRNNVCYLNGNNVPSYGWGVSNNEITDGTIPCRLPRAA